MEPFDNAPAVAECAKDAHSLRYAAARCAVLLGCGVQLPPGIVLALVLAGLCCGTCWGVASACCTKFAPELYLRSHIEW